MQVEYITVGTVVNAHGIRGEVKVNPAGFEPAFIAGFRTLYIGGRAVEVRSARVHKSTVLLTLPGVEDMDAALALKGEEVAIRRADAVLPEGEYFDAELEGLTVVDDATGETLGTLCRVLNYPAHKVYEVKGEREYLIPHVKAFVPEIDLSRGYVDVTLIEGMDLNED